MKTLFKLLIPAFLTALSFNINSWAGIYLSGEPLAIPRNASFSQVRLILSELRALSIPSDAIQQPSEASLKPFYVDLSKELETKQNAGTATFEEKIRLGGCYLRLNQPTKAATCLEKANKEIDPKNAPHELYFNLAMAYSNGDLLLDRAIEFQKQGLNCFSKPPESSFANWQFNRRSEIFLLKFLQEKQSYRDRRIDSQNLLTKIFADFEGEWKKNNFKPSQASFSFLDSLAPDTTDLVIKLLSCFPQDNNLFWLYGEMLNATGDPISASKILDELVNARQMSSNPVLFEHSRILRRQTGESPKQIEKNTKDTVEKTPDTESTTSTNQTTLFSGDLRYLLVGLITGIVASFIIQLQLKNWFAK